MVNQSSRKSVHSIVNSRKIQAYLSSFRYPTVTPTAETDEIGVWVSYTWQRRGIAVCKVTDGG